VVNITVAAIDITPAGYLKEDGVNFGGLYFINVHGCDDCGYGYKNGYDFPSQNRFRR
jgi:hypothetical protein